MTNIRAVHQFFPVGHDLFAAGSVEFWPPPRNSRRNIDSGKFMIGANGEEVPHTTFEEALACLQSMATPRWRRPNDAGNWGIVSGRDWKRVERCQLMSM